MAFRKSRPTRDLVERQRLTLACLAQNLAESDAPRAVHRRAGDRDASLGWVIGLIHTRNQADSNTWRQRWGVFATQYPSGQTDSPLHK